MPVKPIAPVTGSVTVVNGALIRFGRAQVSACRARHPGIEFAIGEHNAADVTEAVATARLHCGLLCVPVARPPGLAFETLLREPVRVALPVDHPLATTGGGARRRAAVASTELAEGGRLRPGAAAGRAGALCEPARAVRGARFPAPHRRRGRPHDDQPEPGRGRSPRVGGAGVDAGCPCRIGRRSAAGRKRAAGRAVDAALPRSRLRRPDRAFRRARAPGGRPFGNVAARDGEAGC